VGEQDRLGVLHMGHPRHGYIDMPGGLSRERGGQRGTGGMRFGRSAPNKHPKFGGDHFVAAAPGVQLRA